MSGSSTRHYPARLGSLLHDLEAIKDPEERSLVLIGYAERFRPVPPEIATRPYPVSNRVPYCESEAYVWFIPHADHTLDLHFAVENPSGISAKALAAILGETVSGAPAEAIAALPENLVQRIFRQNISMGKGIGLSTLVEMVRTRARGLTGDRSGGSCG